MPIQKRAEALSARKLESGVRSDYIAAQREEHQERKPSVQAHALPKPALHLTLFEFIIANV
jgi:hypothetical protein